MYQILTENKPFCAIGFDLFSIMRRQLIDPDIIAVVRHNKNLEKFAGTKQLLKETFPQRV